MRYALRAIAILTGFATAFIAAATVAYARIVSSDPPVVPGRYNRFPGGEAAVPSPSTAELPLWQFLAFVALAVLMAVAIVALGYSLSHSRMSGRARRSQQPLTH